MTTPPSPFADSTAPASPFADGGATTDNAIVDVTAEANVKLKELRDMEPETTQLGLRIEIISAPGEDFRYDLSFEKVTTAAFTDEVRTIDGLKIIVPANSIELLTGSILDYNDTQGLIIRNPNKPLAPSVDGLVSDDAMSVSINDVLRSEVNPALAAHGGFVTFVGHDGEGTAYLTMGGGCHGCSMSRMTMLEGEASTRLRCAWSNTASTCSCFTPGNHSRKSATVAPLSRFSNSARTGTRVPLKSQTPLTFPGTRSTAEHSDQLSMLRPWSRPRRNASQRATAAGGWSGRQDSNLRPPGPKPGALPG